jgi:glucose/arabinose dehydrogenase
MGVAVSPDFLIDRYIYIFYPWPKNGNCGESDVDGPVARLSRFVMAEDFMSVDEDSETVLMETTPLSDDIHNGGAMDFGKDGYLYVSIGTLFRRGEWVVVVLVVVVVIVSGCTKHSGKNMLDHLEVFRHYLCDVVYTN